MISSVYRVERGHFLTTRRAPSRPEVNYYDLAARLRKIETLAIQLLDYKERRRLTDFSPRERRACGAKESGHASSERDQA
jgi:hypothetical protein